MLRRLYQWTLAQADSLSALMIPMILARPSRAWLVATVCLAGSVLCGVAGYGIGAFFVEQLGRPILEALGKADAMTEFTTRFNDLGFWLVLIAGITALTYNAITIMSGWTGLPLGTFIITSIIARGCRFCVVAALLWRFGAPIKDFIERHLGLMFTRFNPLLVGRFFMVRFL